MFCLLCSTLLAFSGILCYVKWLEGQKKCNSEDPGDAPLTFWGSFSPTSDISGDSDEMHYSWSQQSCHCQLRMMLSWQPSIKRSPAKHLQEAEFSKEFFRQKQWDSLGPISMGKEE